MSFTCPACGYSGLDKVPWSEKSGGSLEICPSCGIQFGYSDAVGGDSVRRQKLYEVWRAKWIADGMIWRGQRERPAAWNPVAQLRNVT